VGINVRRLREGRDLSQEELAFEAELHRTYISGVERGVRNPTVTVVAKIAKALGVTPDQLLRQFDSLRADIRLDGIWVLSEDREWVEREVM
jgi:transcriptional regulator with XRE-family HTH domain